MPDYTGQFCRQAGEMLAPPARYPNLPVGALPDEAARIRLITETENLIADELYISPNRIRSPADTASRIRAGSPLNAAAEAILSNQGPNVAAGMAMRFYAGFFDVAKALRETANADGGGTLAIDDQLRRALMADVHINAQKDPIYHAGACFGWWGRKRPDRDQQVFDGGIDDLHKNEYLADYYHQYPPPTTGS
jgi:hypothetical protein